MSTLEQKVYEETEDIIEEDTLSSKIDRRDFFKYVLAFGTTIYGFGQEVDIAFADPDKWTKKADMPTARFSLSTSVVNGKIYAIGGWAGSPLSTVEEYDPMRNKWRKKADMPTARYVLSTSVVGGIIYAIGGRTLNLEILPTVEAYDPTTDTWSKKADMPTPRAWLSTSVVNGKIYAIGGAFEKDGRPALSKFVEEYDPMTDTWSKKAKMLTARYQLSTSAVNGKIYAIGGWGLDAIPGPALSTVEEYDPSINKWMNKAKMPTARISFSTSAVNGKIYAIGGWGEDAAMKLPTVEEYDLMRNKWRKKADMPTARSAFSTSAVNGKVYAIGGEKYPIIFSIVEEYDPGLVGLGIEAKGKLVTSWGKLKSGN